uniref:Uncharacterized protein n=1 Tax=Molossus molossus TaxID=27622 RepID=A0A7J8GRE3_MOLMO|nr:hypothetical protein HJG59_011240 [Molossus molossus]
MLSSAVVDTASHKNKKKQHICFFVGFFFFCVLRLPETDDAAPIRLHVPRRRVSDVLVRFHVSPALQGCRSPHLAGEAWVKNCSEQELDPCPRLRHLEAVEPELNPGVSPALSQRGPCALPQREETHTSLNSTAPLAAPLSPAQGVTARDPVATPPLPPPGMFLQASLEGERCISQLTHLPLWTVDGRGSSSFSISQS